MPEVPLYILILREYSPWVMDDSRSMISFSLGWVGSMFKTLSSTQTLLSFWFISVFFHFCLFKCSGSLFRLLQRSATKLGVRRHVHMALDIVSAFFWYYDSIMHIFS
jgi:hypothetical protein